MTSTHFILIQDYNSVFKFCMIFCTLLSGAAHILPRLSRASGRQIKQCIDHLIESYIEYQRTCHVNPAAAPKYAMSCCVLKEELEKWEKLHCMHQLAQLNWFLFFHLVFLESSIKNRIALSHKQGQSKYLWYLCIELFWFLQINQCNEKYRTSGSN